MIYCYIMISIALVSIIPFWIRNKILFKNSFGGLLGTGFSCSTLSLHNTLHNGIFNVTNNFFNYTTNLILKFIIFAALIFVEHFTDTIIISILYLLYLLISWFVYKKRKAYYITVSEEQPISTLTAAYKACVSLPIYHTILFILIEIMYIFSL